MIRILVAATALWAAPLGQARAADLTSHVMAMCPIERRRDDGDRLGHGPSTATVVDVEGGASIVIVPVVVEDLELLRAAVQASADRLQRDGCDMMGQTRR